MFRVCQELTEKAVLLGVWVLKRKIVADFIPINKLRGNFVCNHDARKNEQTCPTLTELIKPNTGRFARK